jgi:hypothetical protein
MLPVPPTLALAMAPSSSLVDASLTLIAARPAVLMLPA